MNAQIHGVSNLRALVIRALQDELRDTNAYLEPDEYEECLAFLVLKAVELGARYDPDKGSLAFGQLAYSLTRRRYIDWLRKRERELRFLPVERVPETVGEDPESLVALAQSLDSPALSTGSRRLLKQIAVTKLEAGMPIGPGYEKRLRKLQQELITTGIVSVNGSVHFT